MDWLFDWCVYVLEVSAQYVGMTYNEINIWVFVIIEPVVFVWMVYSILRLGYRLRGLSEIFASPTSWLALKGYMRLNGIIKN